MDAYRPDGCPSTDTAVRLTGVVTLTGYCLVELYETIIMGRWLWSFPTTEVTEPLQFLADPESLAPIGYASGVSKYFKFTLLFLVLLPKFLIGAALWWFGAMYIARSPDNDELILNTVAILFVLEIDDMLAKVAIPNGMSRLLDALPAIPSLDATAEEIKKQHADGELCCECKFDGTLNSCWRCFCGSCFDSVMCAAWQYNCGQWVNFGVIAGMSAAVLITACEATSKDLNVTNATTGLV